MFRLFLTHSLRYFARHPALTALNIVGIALGVTVLLAVQIINHSALESFHLKISDPLRLETQTGTEIFHIGYMLDFGEDAPGATTTPPPSVRRLQITI